MIKEDFNIEQFFFDQDTLFHLTNIIKQFNNPCLLCAPTIGRELTEQNIKCTTLDIDNRFSFLPGFHQFDLLKPLWNSEEKFGIILCDPPLFTATIPQLFEAIKLLCHNDFTQPLLVSYLIHQKEPFLKLFEPFNLEATGYYPGYQSVKTFKKPEIEIYGNLNKSII